MKLNLQDAQALAERSLVALGYTQPDAGRITAHLMDCELRGLGYAGLARILSVADRLGGQGPSCAPMRILKESPVSARLTSDPAAALAGAFAPWGGHRGSGLALVVQLLGMLAGPPAMPGEVTDFGFLAIALEPDLLTDPAVFQKEVAAYSDTLRATRPLHEGEAVRVPFERSRIERERRRASTDRRCRGRRGGFARLVTRF